VRRVVELLLDHGADVNEVHDNEYGAMSALYGAAGVAHDPETTQLLLERGADPNDGESVYHAVEAEDTTCLELLLRAGATVRDTNALANAIDDPVKVRVLLEHGDLRPADPELRDALLYARAPAVVTMLIEHGASLDARDCDGLTPYARAARFNSEETMKLLEAAGSTAAPRFTTRVCGVAVARSRCCSHAGRTRRRGVTRGQPSAPRFPGPHGGHGICPGARSESTGTSPLPARCSRPAPA